MILALTGYAQSGKDTVGRMLVEHHGFTRVAFADKLKELAYEIDPHLGCGSGTGSEVWGFQLRDLVDYLGWEEAKKDELEVREFLQKLGVACREVLGRDVWIEAALNHIIYEQTNHNIVITDVRFLNEADYVRDFFDALKTIDYRPVQVVRIQRPGFGPLNDHVSETELDSIRCDHVLLNDGDLYDLERKVRSLVIDDSVHVPSS